MIPSWSFAHNFDPPGIRCWRRLKVGRKYRGWHQKHKAVIHSPGAVAHPEQGGSWAVGNCRFCHLSILFSVANILYRASSSLMHLSSFARPAHTKALITAGSPSTVKLRGDIPAIFNPWKSSSNALKEFSLKSYKP